MQYKLDLEQGFYLDGWLVEPMLCRVSKLTRSIRLEPKIMDVLVLLAANDGRVVRKEEILTGVWGAVNVVENVLARAISELRRTFGDDPKKPHVIETIPKVGYRLVAEIAPLAGFEKAVHEFEELPPFLPPLTAEPVAVPDTYSMIHGRSFLWGGAAAGLLIFMAMLALLILLPRLDHHEEREIEVRRLPQMQMHR